jgi:xanthine/uracil/vitamin C permease (AzgA family)
MPYAQAPGMGLNSTRGLMVAAGESIYGFKFTYENAMALGFIYSVIVMIISVVPCM